MIEREDSKVERNVAELTVSRQVAEQLPGNIERTKCIAKFEVEEGGLHGPLIGTALA